MKILIKLLKILGMITLVAVAIIGALFGYDYNEKLKRETAELSFATEKEWTWHDKYDRIQIHFDKEMNKSILRKVNMHEKYVVYAYKKDNYNLAAFVKFIVSCKPSSKIETSEKYSSGEPITLGCNKNGDALSYSVTWDRRDTDFVWEENLDGFKVRANFGYWDFTKLDQEVTLLKAK